jgi:hypothetical protein
MIDIRQLCREKGVPITELTALFGCQSSVKSGRVSLKSTAIQQRLWLFTQNPDAVTKELLHYWLANGPKSGTHLVYLRKFARRFLSPEVYRVWNQAVSAKYPLFACETTSRTVIVSRKAAAR